LYRGHKILPYCPRCGTALSSHELALGYADVEDPSVYIALDIENSARRILVWTTTPWTLVSNAALAVHPDLEYVELVRRENAAAGAQPKERDQRTIIIADARVRAVLGDDYDNRWSIVGECAEPISSDSGIVARSIGSSIPRERTTKSSLAKRSCRRTTGPASCTCRPRSAPDDYAAGQRHNLAFLNPVGARGEFPSSMPIVGGLFVKDADALLIEELKRHGVLWKAGRLTHSYPHCWRCGTPLLYYARTSWFVRTTAFKDSMLARNARVDWHPASVGAGTLR
jgi:isoleucyl-tRNA synthetase